MSGRLDGKVAIVTGASGGIGAASVERFVAEGAKVVLADLPSGALDELAARFGQSAMAVPTDVSDMQAVRACVSRTVERFGGLDVMFANAGIEGALRPILDLTSDDLDRVLAVNVRGTFGCIKEAARVMRPGGAILVTSSIAGLIGSVGLAAYCASKHAVMGLVKCAAVELAPQHIRVVAINPGPIENRMMRSVERQMLPENPGLVKDGFIGMVPLRRYGSNLEIANLAVFLASAEASYCTGTSFVADGGYLAL